MCFAAIPYTTVMHTFYKLPEIRNLVEVTSHLISNLDRVYMAYDDDDYKWCNVKHMRSIACCSLGTGYFFNFQNCGDTSQVGKGGSERGLY